MEVRPLTFADETGIGTMVLLLGAPHVLIALVTMTTLRLPDYAMNRFTAYLVGLALGAISLTSFFYMVRMQGCLTAAVFAWSLTLLAAQITGQSVIWSKVTKIGAEREDAWGG